METQRAQYHLRIQLRPGPDIQERASALARFCVEHEIEEAVFFVDAETANNGFLSDGETEEWFAALGVAKGAMDGAGVRSSLNPWYTVLHTDRGRHQPEGWAFTPMVSPTGEAARAVASLACPRWREYVARLYGRLAELGFRVVWIEDDFRYHNHAPLTWGGDFSAAMLGRFAAKIGREVAREELVAAILRPGEPHPWRALWLETWREAQIEAAQVIRDAAVGACPDTLVGLMSSHPTSHSAEGRDWAALFRSMANRGRTVHRPHFAGYQDSARGDLARSSFMLDYQKELRPTDLEIEVTPELENYPMTPFSKSDTVTWGQMALAQVHGAGAQMLDIFSFEVHHIADEPWVGAFLDRVRPGLDALAARFPDSLSSSGVGVLWRPDASLHVRTVAGRSMTELHVPLTPAAEILQTLGIAVQARPGAVNCLWGQAAWACAEDDLLRFLGGGLWLDAEAAAILQQRGLGAYLPAVHRHWWQREEMNYSVERPADRAAGLEPHIAMSVNSFERVACLELSDGAAAWSTLCDPRDRRLGVGLAVGANELGGRVAVSAWPLATEPNAYTLSVNRQRLVQRLIGHLAERRDLPVMVGGAAFAFPLDFRGPGSRQVVLFNASLDGQRPVATVPAATALKEALLFAPDGTVRPLECTSRTVPGELEVEVSEAVSFCGLAVLEVD